MRAGIVTWVQAAIALMPQRSIHFAAAIIDWSVRVWEEAIMKLGKDWHAMTLKNQLFIIDAMEKILAVNFAELAAMKRSVERRQKKEAAAALATDRSGNRRDDTLGATGQSRAAGRRGAKSKQAAQKRP